MKKNIVRSLASVFIPIILMCLVYRILGIYPFGTKTLFTNDMSYEYVAFFAQAGELLRGNSDFLYSFKKVLGGDMAGLFGYYLLSPFNLLAVFFKPHQMPEFVLLITLLKIGFSGLTMNLYLWRIREERFSLVFSTAYALMAYNIAYQQNIIWLDGVIFLPLMVWGIDRILEKKSWYLYIFSLMGALVTSFYIGYMLCLFSVLYFGVRCVILWKSNSGKENFEIIRGYLSASLLSGGLAAITLLPTAVSLQGGKSEIHLKKLLQFKLLHKPGSVLMNLIPGNFDIQGGSFNSANIYCGLFIFVFALAYLAAGRKEWKNRIGYGFLALILFLSLLFKNTERIWHGLELPTGYPHRFSFLFSFTVIVMAYLGWRKAREVLSGAKYVWRLLCALFITVSLSELTVNAAMVLDCFGYEDVNAYRQSVRTDSALIAQLRKRDDSFYRMEDLYGGFGMNKPMLMNYRGLSSSYSGEKLTTKRTAANLGLNEKPTWIAYHDQMPVGMDSLLNLKYLIAPDNCKRNAYRIAAAKDDMVLYENPYVLPLGVLADGTILDADIENRDMFAIQNEVWNSILRDNEQLYMPIDAKERYREDDGVTYEFTVDRNLEIYTNFMDDSLVDICRIYLNNTELASFEPEKAPYRLGRFKEGDVIRVEIRSDDKNINWYDLFFYYENISVLERNINRIREEAYRIAKYNEHSFQGNIRNYTDEERYLFFTIPCDRGWKITVDGKRTEPLTALGSLMCVRIPEGEHEVELRFMPRGLAAGGFISLLSLICVLIIYKRQNPLRGDF